MASDSPSSFNKQLPVSTYGFGADQDSTTVTKLEGHAELVTDLVNTLLQTYIIANDDNYGAQLAA